MADEAASPDTQLLHQARSALMKRQKKVMLSTHYQGDPTKVAWLYELEGLARPGLASDIVETLCSIVQQENVAAKRFYHQVDSLSQGFVDAAILDARSAGTNIPDSAEEGRRWMKPQLMTLVNLAAKEVDDIGEALASAKPLLAPNVRPRYRVATCISIGTDHMCHAFVSRRVARPRRTPRARPQPRTPRRRRWRTTPSTTRRITTATTTRRRASASTTRWSTT